MGSTDILEEFIFINNSGEVFVRVVAFSEKDARAELKTVLSNNKVFEFADPRWNLIGSIPVAELDQE